MDWFIKHFNEIFATVTGILYIFLSIRQNILLWPVGIISSVFFVWVYFDSKIYADMGLNVYYVFISLWGWYNWRRRKSRDNEKSIPVISLTQNMKIKLIVLTIALYCVIILTLNYLSDSDVKYIDSFTTSLSIIATWMLTKKYIEQWLIWVVVNTVSIGLYIYKDLYFTSFLFLVYTIMAIKGYYEWKKDK